MLDLEQYTRQILGIRDSEDDRESDKNHDESESGPK